MRTELQRHQLWVGLTTQTAELTKHDSLDVDTTFDRRCKRVDESIKTLQYVLSKLVSKMDQAGSAATGHMLLLVISHPTSPPPQHTPVALAPWAVPWVPALLL